MNQLSHRGRVITLGIRIIRTDDHAQAGALRVGDELKMPLRSAIFLIKSGYAERLHPKKTPQQRFLEKAAALSAEHAVTS